MPIEPVVAFLNVDLELFGDFDRKPLLRALSRSAILLHEGGGAAGEPALVFEVNDVGLDVPGTLARFLKLVEKLPRPARRTWDAATRRRFDVGIQGGKRPHMTCWTVSPELLAAIVEADAELAITVYGAEWRDVPAEKKTKAGALNPKSQRRGSPRP